MNLQPYEEADLNDFIIDLLADERFLKVYNTYKSQLEYTCAYHNDSTKRDESFHKLKGIDNFISFLKQILLNNKKREQNEN